MQKDKPKTMFAVYSQQKLCKTLNTGRFCGYNFIVYGWKAQLDLDEWK